MPELLTFADILAARDRIAGTAVRTPLVPLDPDRVQASGQRLPAGLSPVFLKNEAAQPIGSFKLRGAFNKIAALKKRDPEAFQRGVITYSSGNHAQGVAYAARALGTRAVIVMPGNAPEVKRQATAALGAEIVTVGPASTERKQKAEELVAQHGYAMIPPYDDPEIIAGQATCGLEIVEQLAALDAQAAPRESGAQQGADQAGDAVPKTLILSPVSGGGLLSGVSTGAKLGAEHFHMPAPLVCGVEPELAGDAAESFRAKTLVEWPANLTTRTLADGLRTQSLGQRNFEHILHFTDMIVTVSEEQIRAATRLLLQATDIVPEPSGAVTLAAVLFRSADLPRADRIVAVVSGGNIDPALRAELESETVTSLV